MILEVFVIRLKDILPDFISSNQAAYLKNRYINESKSERLIHHVLEKASILNKKGFLVAVDFEKAFDLIGSSFLPPVLQKYSFGKSFLKWIQILIENQESYVVNGGITQHS